MTSEHEMYRNDPAARHEHKTSITLDPDSKRQPRMTPTGVKDENTSNSFKMKESLFGNVLARLIPREIAAAPLCMTIAIENRSVP